MSWSFQRSKLSPSDMIKAADEYFSQPHIATMAQPEHDLAIGVRIQITKAATAMPEGWLMNVNAYGSASTDQDRPNNSRNSLTVSIAYEAIASTQNSGSAPQEARNPLEGASETDVMVSNSTADDLPQGEPATTNKRKSG